MPVLFRPRTVWLPTAWGLLVLALVAVLLTWALAWTANDYFAVTQPVKGRDGRSAKVLVVEGWVGEVDLDRAVALVRQRGYERVIASGGPIPSWSPFPSYAERAADYLRNHGLTDVPVDAVASPRTLQDRTFVSAVWVRDWAAKRQVPIDSLDVFTSGVHARRTHLLYQMAFGDAVPVGIISSPPEEWDTRRWWTNSYALKTLIGEAVSMVWTKCCFWPGPPGSHDERWAVPKGS